MAGGAVELDLRGKVCPYTTLDTLKALKRLPPGAVLEVLVDFYPSVDTVPDECRERGHQVEVTEVGDKHWRITVRKQG